MNEDSFMNASIKLCFLGAAAIIPSLTPGMGRISFLEEAVFVVTPPSFDSPELQKLCMKLRCAWRASSKRITEASDSF